MSNQKHVINLTDGTVTIIKEEIVAVKDVESYVDSLASDNEIKIPQLPHGCISYYRKGEVECFAMYRSAGTAVPSVRFTGYNSDGDYVRYSISNIEIPVPDRIFMFKLINGGLSKYDTKAFFIRDPKSPGSDFYNPNLSVVWLPNTESGMHGGICAGNGGLEDIDADRSGSANKCNGFADFIDASLYNSDLSSHWFNMPSIFKKLPEWGDQYGIEGKDSAAWQKVIQWREEGFVDPDSDEDEEDSDAFRAFPAITLTSMHSYLQKWRNDGGEAEVIKQIREQHSNVHGMRDSTSFASTWSGYTQF